jgi:hypothetical protein
MYVATARSCLEQSEIEYVVHEKTNIRTALGNIVIIEITKEGLVLLAGPSSKNTMKELLNILQKYNPYKVLIDGALFRKSISSSVISDAVIFVTGASYSSNINNVIEDTKQIVDQLRISKPVNAKKYYEKSNENIVLYDENNEVQNKITQNLLNSEDKITELINKNVHVIQFNGAFTDRFAEVIISNRKKLNDISIIVQDASYILISPENYDRLQKMGVKLYALNQIEILFVAYNPTSPYSYDFDNNEFRSMLRDKIDIDIVNILQDLR